MWHANELLDRNILENGSISRSLEFGSACESILEIKPLIEVIIGRKPIKLELEIDGIKHFRFVFDKQRLQQVILNLTSNAIKFT